MDESQQRKGPVGDATGPANEPTHSLDSLDSGDGAQRTGTGPAEGNPPTPGPVLSGNGAGSLPSDDRAEQEPRHHKVKVMAEPGETATRPTGDERPIQSPPAALLRPTAKPDAKVDPLLRHQEVVKGSHPGDKYVRYGRNAGAFRRQGGMLSASLATEVPRGAWGRLIYRTRRVLIGRPISTEQSIHERLTNVKALAVLSSDALSSVAYATEEILRVLILATVAGGLSFTLPIGFAVMLLLAIVAISYRQTIAAYPRGGGSYIVAKDNLGTLPGLTAAASILIDYTMTVAVSTTAGVAAIYSLFPSLQSIRVEICVGIVILVTIANLRGVREAGNIFAVPTYLFVVGILGMIAFGLLRTYLGIGGQPVYIPPSQVNQAGAEGITLFLLLRAFTQGCTALTGVEAIADGVPAFRPPEAKNARTTLLWMAGLAITMFGGITLLASRINLKPSDQETVLSQLARTIFPSLGNSDPLTNPLSNPLWLYIQIATALILVLAANTAFSDFPRLSYFLARDKFMPHQYSFRGDRLAFSWGIVTLAILACIILIAFNGDTTALIPLYTVGVFNSFTLSQAGMVKRWWTLRTPGWQRSLIINALGATATAIVLIISAVTKFLLGAWIVLLLIPILIAMFLAINRHYRRVASEVAAIDIMHPMPYKHTFIVPVSSLNAVTRTALNYAASLSKNVYAVHIVEGEDTEEAERFNRQWRELYPEGDIQLVIIESPYRSLLGPLLSYIDALDKQSPDDTVTIVLPEFLPARPWEYLLHNQSALRLKAALLFRRNTVVADVPYHLGRTQASAAVAAFPWVPLGVLVSVLLLIYFFFIRK
jgi:amino acid transporter